MGIQNIKNIKVVIPTTYSDNLWIELYARRDKLLRTSDWVLLDDCNLTSDCILNWKQWRKSLKGLTREKFTNYSTALKMLDNIRAIQPLNVYNGIKSTKVKKRVIMKKLENKIQKLENDIKTLAKAVLDMQDGAPLPTNLKDLKKIANTLLKKWYNHEVNTSMAAPINIIIERCEQAIDYKVLNDIKNSPIVETHSNITGKSYDEISNMFIHDKTEMLLTISALDVLKHTHVNNINKASTMGELKNIIETISID